VKPHEKSMALGELACHLGNIPNWAGTILDRRRSISGPRRRTGGETSRAEILAVRPVEEDPRLMDRRCGIRASWSLKRGGQDMFSMPRIAAFRSFILNHTIHHRGQLSVYLRLNQIPVPPIYGPTADEIVYRSSRVLE
jgi:hypothetical protein